MIVIHFRTKISSALLAATAISLAACNTSTEAPPTYTSTSPGLAGPSQAASTGLGSPTPPPFGTPSGVRGRNQELPIQRGTTSVGIDPARAANAAGAPPGGQARNANQGFPGQWRAQSASNGSLCGITLYGSPDATAGAATTTSCSFSTLSGLTSWEWNGTELHLKNGTEVALRLAPVGENRYDGTASWGFLTTRIALFR